MYMSYRMMCPDRLRIYGVFQTRSVTTSPLSANKQTFICQTDFLYVSKCKPACFFHITCQNVNKSIILFTDWCVTFCGMNLRLRKSHFCAENREVSAFISDKFVNERNWYVFENIKKEDAIILDKIFPLSIKYTYIKSRVQNHSLFITHTHTHTYI
jgi:hypothetical protein